LHGPSFLFKKDLKTKIYNSQFWLLCLSSLLFFASFNMIIPELPGYLESLGGAEYKGLIIALFTVTAMLARPFSGKLADSIGRIPVIMAGAIVCIICSALYPVIATVAGVLWLRLLHGFSTGFTPTGQTAYLADIIPIDRRGEGMGILGTANTIGMAGGAAFGGTLSSYASLNVVFYCSAATAAVAVLLLIGLKETLMEKASIRVQHLRVRISDLFEPRVLAPCIVMGLTAYSYGAVITMVPDYSIIMGIKNKGLLLTYMTIASLAVRLMGGKASDKWGRKPVLLVSASLMAIGMFLISVAHSKTELIIGMVVYGMSQGITSPTLLAWATDLSNPEKKGRGVSSIYIFMELGIGIGAFVSGLIFANQADNILETFVICAALAATSVIFLVAERFSINWKT
jgi:MFS family permease